MFDTMIAQTFRSDIASITAKLFLALVFLAVALPTGSIIGVNVKIIVFGIFLVALALHLGSSYLDFSYGDLFFLLGVAVGLLFWSLLGALHGTGDQDQILDQLRNMGSAIVIAWFSIFGIRRGLFRPEKLMAAIVYGLCAVSIAKLLLVAGSFISNIDPIAMVRSIFGETSTVADPIGFGLFRLEFAADILGAFALFALLAPSVSGIRVGSCQTLFICVVIFLGCGLLAYSRYVWLAYLVCIFAAIIVERRWKTMVVLLVTAIVIGTASYDVLSAVFTARFASIQVEDSDYIRAEQSAALIGEFKSRPILGKGIGTHVNTVIRNDVHTYGYELQWLAYLMQFGIAGEMAITVLVLLAARDLLTARHPAKPWLVLLYLLWLAGSWTNPYLTSSFAGATFGLFMAMFYRIKSGYGINSRLKTIHTPVLEHS